MYTCMHVSEYMQHYILVMKDILHYVIHYNLQLSYSHKLCATCMGIYVYIWCFLTITKCICILDLSNGYRACTITKLPTVYKATM